MNLTEHVVSALDSYAEMKKISCQQNRGPIDAVPILDGRDPIGQPLIAMLAGPPQAMIDTAIAAFRAQGELVSVVLLMDSVMTSTPPSEGGVYPDGELRRLHSEDPTADTEEALVAMGVDTDGEVLEVVKMYVYSDAGLPVFAEPKEIRNDTGAILMAMLEAMRL